MYAPPFTQCLRVPWCAERFRDGLVSCRWQKSVTVPFETEPGVIFSVAGHGRPVRYRMEARNRTPGLELLTTSDAGTRPVFLLREVERATL